MEQTPKYLLIARGNGKWAASMKVLEEAAKNGQAIIYLTSKDMERYRRERLENALRKARGDYDPPSLYPIEIEPPKIMEPEPWLSRNPALDRCAVIDEYRDKVVYGRFSEAKAATTNGENTGQV